MDTVCHLITCRVYLNRFSQRKRTEGQGWAWLFRRRLLSATLGPSRPEAAPFPAETARLSELFFLRSVWRRSLRLTLDKDPKPASSKEE
jgi:hypothetical protein